MEEALVQIVAGTIILFQNIFFPRHINYLHGLGIPDWSLHDLSANLIDLEQSWPLVRFIDKRTVVLVYD